MTIQYFYCLYLLPVDQTITVIATYFHIILEISLSFQITRESFSENPVQDTIDKRSRRWAYHKS